MTAFDFLVVGGGPVGLSAALALTRKGLHGQVIDQAEAMPQRPSTDAIGLRSPRVSAINQSSIQFCEQLGIHSAFFQQNGCRFTDMQVWDAEGSGHIRFSADEAGTAVLGHIVENDVTQAALNQQVAKQPTLTRFDGVSVSALQTTASGRWPP